MTNDEIKNVLQQKYSPNKVDTLIGKNLTSSIVSQQPKYLGSYSVESGNVLDMDRNRNLVSRYENYQGAYGNEDRLAKEQTWYGQLGNAVGKWVGKSFLNAADGITSYTYGIGKAIADGDISSMWNNDLTNFFDDQSKRLDRAMPILFTDEEKVQGALGKTFTWSYALDSVSNGMAFITGAMLSEVPLAVLTGGASLPTSLARFGAKTALKNVDNLAVGLAKEAVENTATKAVKNTFSESGVKALRNLNRNTAIGEAVGEGLKTVSFAARSSMFEAGMEARHNFRDNVDNFINKYQEEKGELPSYDVLKSYIDDANTTANAVFAGNMAVLSLSNVAMFGKMFGLKPQFTGISKAWNKSLGLGVDTLADGTKVLGKANVFQKALGYSSPIIGKALTEGVFEEGTQGILGKAMTSYLDGKYLNNNATMTYFDALAEGAREQYGTSDGIHEMIMGGLIGIIGVNASAVVAKTGVLGQETKKNSQFGIAGFFQDSYGAKRKRTQAEIENYNKSVAPFRASTRLNSVGSVFSNENIDDFGLAEDTVNNYNFIKTSEQYKDFTDTVADFNTMIDSHQFDPQQLREMNLSEEQVVEYKQGLKDKFLKDYESYTKASKIVDRLDLTGGNLTNGNLNELKDSVTFSLMFADKAGQDAQKVSENISQLVGEGGIYDALKFFQGVDEENINLLDDIKQKQEEKQKLTELIVELGEDSETNETRMKELAKQRESATNKILKLETEIKNLNDILSNKAQTLGQQASAKQESTTNVQTLINQYNSINNYIDSLEKTGKTKDASDLKFLISQFKALNAIDASSQQTIRRMLDTNFFEGEGKGFIAKVLGNTYNPSEQFLEDLRANEQIISPLLEAFGIEENDIVSGVTKMMKDNTELSDKEKYLLESVVRTLEARKRVIKYVSEVKDTEAQDRTPQTETRGDRLSRVRIPENITTIEQLNNIIKTISNEIDVLTNQPTREALKQIKSLEKQLADARQRLLDLQNGKIITKNTIQEQETSNESEEEIIVNHVNQILIDFPEIIAESAEEEIEEAFNEAIQDNFLEKAVETLRNDLEDLETSELPDQELIDQIKQQIEQYERQINGENIGVNAGEASDSVSEGDTETSEGTAVQSPTQNDNSLRIQETQEEIDRLENEIKELKTPFKFLDSESYKEYRKLLDKKMTPDSGYNVEDDLRLTELENSIDKWITILGTEVEGVELSDLIKQLVTLENIEVSEGSNVEEVSDEEMESDIKTANVSTDNNFNTGINTKLVVGRSIRRDGNIFTIISNITLDKFKQLSGVGITEDDVLILPDTKGITISQNLVDKINEQGNIIILQNNAGETGTYSSPVLIKTVDMKGNEEYSMLETDFEENIDDDKASEVKAGESLNLAVDTSIGYNKEHLDKVRTLQEDGVTEDNLEQEVEKQIKIDLAKDKIIQELQNKIRLIENSTFISTTKKAEKNKLQNKLNERMNKVEDNARAKVEKKLSTQKLIIPKELRQELADNLRISVVDKDGVNVQTLKGTRRNQSSKVEADKSSLEALRTRIVEDDIFLMSLLSQEYTMVPVEGLTIKVDHVYPGLPNFNYSSDASSKVYKPIEKQNTQNIVDIGYIQGGRALSRNNTEFDKTLIKTSMNRKNSTKTPFIVVKRGSTNVAIPVRVGREESAIDLTLFTNVFNAENMTVSEKANKLNSMMAQGGIDVSQPENAFIALGDNLSQEKFDELFGKLSEKEYLRSVDNWTDKNVSIQTALEQAEASTNINLSQPFKGTKIRFNLNEYKPESDNSEEVKNSEVVKEYINSENIGLRRFKNKC